MDVRAYEPQADFEAVSQMLVASYRPGDVFDPWLQPRWEYMHFHPLIRELDLDLSRCGVAEEHGEVVGIVHFEHDPTSAYLQRRPGADHVIDPLLDWAEEHLGAYSDRLGREALVVYAPGFDGPLRSVLTSRGFVEQGDRGEPHTRMTGIARLARPSPPPGYRLQSLADDNDLTKVHRVLWRGFDHEGPPPPGELEGRRFMQSAPRFRPDLTIVTVAPDGDYASFCGMWVVPENRVAYVEPVATDPDHRRRGAGRAAVLEALRRAGAAGADVAWVGSDQDFYLSLGFEPAFTVTRWVSPAPAGPLQRVPAAR